MIKGAIVARRLLAMMPGQEDVTLYSRDAAEAGFTGVAYRAVRKPATKGELILMGAVLGTVYTTFELIRTTQTTLPKLLDAIVDAATVRWEVKKVDVKMEGYVYECLCLQDVQ
jgi:hypothetical protein